MEAINISREELGLLLLATEGHIEELKQRFATENGYVHPGLSYEAILEKLESFYENSIATEYTLTTLIPVDVEAKKIINKAADFFREKGVQ